MNTDTGAIAFNPRLYIAGAWLDARQRPGESVVDPASGETIGEVPHATAADLDAALQAAQHAWPAWRDTPAVERSRVLRRAAELIRARQDAIARILTLEQGKPIAEARLEVAGAAAHIEWMAEEGRRAYGRVVPGGAGVRQTVLRRPIGVVAAFAPWNFPATTPARKLGASLAAGCCCILKGAEETPGTATELVQALHDAGLPPGVANLVFGRPPEISRTLIESPVVRKVSFTGSTAVGRQLAALAGAALKPITMELGGHAPVLVFDDVDVEQVVRLCVTAKYRNAGQVCVSPTRFFIAEGIYDRFARAFADAAEAITVGPGLDPASTMGPLANERRLEAMGTAVSALSAAGARLLAGGERIARTGLYWRLTVYADVPLGADAMREEPFGPLALLHAFRGEREAIELANVLPYGLAAYVYTRDGARQLRLGDAIEAGLVAINGATINGPETPWGGVKDSGYGSEGGSEGLEGYQVTKLVAQSSLF